MGVIVGCLARQNWHREVRRKGLGPADAFDYVLNKTADLGRRFGFHPMGIDFGLGTLPKRDRGYLEELKERLRENNLVAMVGFGGLAVSNDDEIRVASVDEAKRNLEVVAEMGSRTSNFACRLNGRVTRKGQIRIATDMLKEVGQRAGELGIRICQENYETFRSEELIDISRDTGFDNVGIQNDTGNWLILGEDPVTATQECLPYTMHAHVRDYVLERDTYNGVAVGEGLVDFEKILPLLARAGETTDVIWSIEVDTDDRDEDACVDESARYLRGWLWRNHLTDHVKE